MKKLGIGLGFVFGVLLFLVGAYLACLRLTGNVHPVIADQVYRSEQLGAKHLQQVIQTNQIKTIIDLAPIDTLQNEEHIAHIDHLTYIYFPLQSMGITPARQLKQLTYYLQTAKRPLLIHCKAGADRTGLASAMVLILENAPIETAMKQVNLIRYGIINIHSTGRATLKHYVDWLKKHNLKSSKAHFLLWLQKDN